LGKRESRKIFIFIKRHITQNIVTWKWKLKALTININYRDIANVIWKRLHINLRLVILLPRIIDFLFFFYFLLAKWIYLAETKIR
jgi:hypothetical protein